MISVRSGTAMAILLSIAFVVVAVAARDSLPGFASDNANTATSVATRLVDTQEQTNTGAEVQIGQETTQSIEMTGSSQPNTWDDEDSDENDDHDHDDDDHGDHDGKHHDDDDD